LILIVLFWFDIHSGFFLSRVYSWLLCQLWLFLLSTWPCGMTDAKLGSINQLKMKVKKMKVKPNKLLPPPTEKQQMNFRRIDQIAIHYSSPRFLPRSRFFGPKIRTPVAIIEFVWGFDAHIGATHGCETSSAVHTTSIYLKPLHPDFS
jgi:hypothetical protein